VRGAELAAVVARVAQLGGAGEASRQVDACSPHWQVRLPCSSVYHHKPWHLVYDEIMATCE
jgi:hypothetical protein